MMARALMAQALFDGHFALCLIEEDADEWQPEYFDKIRHDWYDCSIEIDMNDQTPLDFMASKDDAVRFLLYGFKRGWFNYADHTEQYFVDEKGEVQISERKTKAGYVKEEKEISDDINALFTEERDAVLAELAHISENAKASKPTGKYSNINVGASREGDSKVDPLVLANQQITVLSGRLDKLQEHLTELENERKRLNIIEDTGANVEFVRGNDRDPVSTWYVSIRNDQGAFIESAHCSKLRDTLDLLIEKVEYQEND